MQSTQNFTAQQYSKVTQVNYPFTVLITYLNPNFLSPKLKLSPLNFATFFEDGAYPLLSFWSNPEHNKTLRKKLPFK